MLNWPGLVWPIEVSERRDIYFKYDKNKATIDGHIEEKESEEKNVKQPLQLSVSEHI